MSELFSPAGLASQILCKQLFTQIQYNFTKDSFDDKRIVLKSRATVSLFHKFDVTDSRR